MRICLITNYPSDHRLRVFEMMSDELGVFFVFTENGQKKNLGRIRHLGCRSKLGQIRHLLRTRYDVVIYTFPPPSTWNSLLFFFVASLRPSKLILWTEEWYEPHTLRRRAIRAIFRLIIRSCGAIVTSGSKATAHMLNYGAVSDKIFVAPDASWIEVPARRVSRPQKSQSSKTLVVLYLGRLVRIKGGDYLIRAFSKLERERDDVKLVIVGDGDFRTELQQMVRDLGLHNVEFMGACKHADSYYFYEMCDVFVLPSIWQPYHCEAWGLTLNEAMQFGKPVIATDAVGAAFDLVKDGVNGFIVKNGDTESLYRALKMILDDRDLAKAMGAQSRKTVEHDFTYSQMASGFRGAITFVQKSRKKGK